MPLAICFAACCKRKPTTHPKQNETEWRIEFNRLLSGKVGVGINLRWCQRVKAAVATDAAAATRSLCYCRGLLSPPHSFTPTHPHTSLPRRLAVAYISVLTELTDGQTDRQTDRQTLITIVNIISW